MLQAKLPWSAGARGRGGLQRSKVLPFMQRLRIFGVRKGLDKLE